MSPRTLSSLGLLAACLPLALTPGCGTKSSQENSSAAAGDSAVIDTGGAEIQGSEDCSALIEKWVRSSAEHDTRSYMETIYPSAVLGAMPEDEYQETFSLTDQFMHKADDRQYSYDGCLIIGEESLDEYNKKYRLHMWKSALYFKDDYERYGLEQPEDIAVYMVAPYITINSDDGTGYVYRASYDDYTEFERLFREARKSDGKKPDYYELYGTYLCEMLVIRIGDEWIIADDDLL